MTVDERVKTRCGAPIGTVEFKHGRTKPREAAATDDGPEEQSAGTEHVTQSKCHRLDVISCFKITDR